MSEIPENPDVYMSGPLSAVSNDEQDRLEEEIYNQVYTACNEIGLKCYCPHKSKTDPSKKIEHGRIWDIDYKKVVTADVLVAYVGTAALGVGAEVEMAREAHNDVILLAETDGGTGHISRLVTGNPAISTRLFFDKNSFADSRERTKLQRNLFKIFSSKTLKRAAHQNDWNAKKCEDMKQTLEASVAGPARDPERSSYQPLSVEDWVQMASEQDTEENSWGAQNGQSKF